MSINMKINSKLEVYDIDGVRVGDAKVQDLEPGYIYMGAPFKNGAQVTLEKGQRFKVIYYGKDQKVFEFESEIVDRKREEIILYKIKEPQVVNQIQRRRSVRIPIILEVLYTEVESDLEKKHVEELKQDAMKKGYSVDLSSTGAGLIVKHEVDASKELLISLKIDGKEIDVIGRTVRIDKQDRRGEEQIKVGVEFEGLKYAVEEKLTNFIFSEMRKQMKRN